MLIFLYICRKHNIVERVLFVLKKNTKKFKFLSQFFVKTGILAGIVFVILSFVLCFYRMDGNNMFPFFQNGDLGIFYRLSSCFLNDVVLYEDSNGDLHVGRIVAVGGQTIEFYEGGGYSVNEYNSLERIPYDTCTDDLSMYPLTLDSDEFFVLNDFRSDMNDSRHIGCIKKSDIKGKLIFLFRCRDF